jgi:hypothetical protein
MIHQQSDFIIPTNPLSNRLLLTGPLPQLFSGALLLPRSFVKPFIAHWTSSPALLWRLTFTQILSLGDEVAELQKTASDESDFRGI